MLSRGFKDQIYDVYRYLPPELQASGPTRYGFYHLCNQSVVLESDFTIEMVGSHQVPGN